MAGFEVGIINIIADNLRDRYKNGFPVLKEIIQNADDAASQVGRDVQLDFGFTQGLHDAEHSLLQGPAIFFLNNGSFSEHDARAVKSFGLNSKAAHNSAIGKFGLGMKSVFHFCEAFFWLAEDGDLKKKEILNPWVRSDGYTVPQSVWDDPSVEDANKIKIHLKEVFKNIGKKYASYFLLWIPLRRQKHLDDLPAEKVGSIISEFPGDNLERVKFLFESDQKKEIAALLPLLRHLTHIQCWRQSKSETLDMQYSIQLQKNAHRSKFPDTKKLSPLSGVVKYGQNHNNSMQYALKFAGYEGYEGEIKLKQLRNSEHWPRSYVRDENGIESPAPDKAKGHCAVTFSRSSEETKGSLDIQWAVFLPVDSNRGEKCPCKSNFTYTLTLHGFFFIDAGRNIIEGLGANKTDIVFPPQSENDLRIAWNYYLSTRGTFRLIIRALEEFVNKARIGVEEVKNSFWRIHVKEEMS